MRESEEAGDGGERRAEIMMARQSHGVIHNVPPTVASRRNACPALRRREHVTLLARYAIIRLPDKVQANARVQDGEQSTLNMTFTNIRQIGMPSLFQRVESAPSVRYGLRCVTRTHKNVALMV